MSLASTPKPPYYAVIFTSIQTDFDGEGYGKAAQRMVELAEKEDGFLGIDTAREEIGVTVSYWRDLASILKWKNNIEHVAVRKKGKISWYKAYTTRICLVEKEYSWELNK